MCRYELIVFCCLSYAFDWASCLIDAMFGVCQVAGMSVGEAQLISLARVLMRKDEVAVVVIDEASSPFLSKPTIFVSQPCLTCLALHVPACMRYVPLFLSSDEITRSKGLETSRCFFMLNLSIFRSL